MSAQVRDPYPVGTPAWADWWEQKWGRGNLDERTRQILDAMRERGCDHSKLDWSGSCDCGEVS